MKSLFKLILSFFLIMIFFNRAFAGSTISFYQTSLTASTSSESVHATSTPCRDIFFEAHPDNSGDLYLSTTLGGASSTGAMTPLSGGQTYSLSGHNTGGTQQSFNLSDFYFGGTNAGDVLLYQCVQ